MQLISFLLLAASIQATPQGSVFQLMGVRAPTPRGHRWRAGCGGVWIAARATDFIQIAFHRGTAEFGHPSDQGNTLFIKATKAA